jgi:hypothetical protein
MENEEEITKLSKINSAALINIRLNNLWLEINKCAVSGSYSKWNLYLDRVWCELGGDVKEKKKKEEKEDDEKSLMEEFKDLDKNVSEELKKIPTKAGFKQFTTKDKENMSKIYDVLMKKEFFLRRLQNKQGKGTAYEESWDEYIHG